MRRILNGIIIVVLSLALVGCNDSQRDNDNDKTKPSNEESTKHIEYETDGDINAGVPLIEVSSYLAEEGYEIRYVGMKTNSEVVAVLINESEKTILLKSYNVIKGKVSASEATVLEDDFLSGNLLIGGCSTEEIFVENKDTNTYIVFDDELKPSKTIELGETAYFNFVTADASRIIYLEKDTNKVYSYNVEEDSKTLIYQFEPEYQILQCVGITDDMNHLMYRYNNTSTQKIGYADIQLEEHSAEYKENITYTIGIAHNEYVYFDYWKEHKEICFYSLEKPRQVRMFSLDSDEETDSIRFLADTGYFVTVMKEDEEENSITNVFKLYNKDEGVLVEKMSVSIEKENVIGDITISKNTELVCISEGKDGIVERVFIWNLTVPSGAIEENEPM